MPILPGMQFSNLHESMRRGATIVLLASLASLAACGGGGGEEAEAAADMASSHASSGGQPLQRYELPLLDALAPTEQVAAVTAGNSCGLASFQAELMQRINAYRARGASCGGYGTFAPTTPLQWNERLQIAAAAHSTDMKTRNFFSHTGSDGSNAGTRITRAGYVWGAWGENIAAGQTSVQAVVDGWMASPGHCANLMKPSFRHVGVACVKGGTGNTYRSYWTLDLARPR